EVITASQSGTIGTVNIISGDFVLPDTTMMSIIRSEDLEVKVAVNESKIAKVKEGQPATITGIAFDGHEYTGRVKQVYPEARKQYIGTTQETVVDVVISIDNPDKHIKTGFTAKAQIETEKPKKLRVLPHEVISQDDEGEFVYAYSGGVAVRRNVITGEEFSGGTEILSGINDNELIISCPSKIKGDGDYVRAKAH
ncbi:MAG: HlyD family efflux transporter periplasmic adaptor subunit, partial [Clostridiales bacterium]|nr:HlyD family efflux transporter periplasmic adaptor subunit [Clostridiales bacterium]